MMTKDTEIRTQYTDPLQKSIRIILPLDLYSRLKAKTPDHGMLSQLIRRLIERHLLDLEG